MPRLVDEHGVPAESAWEAFTGLFDSERRREKKRDQPEDADRDDGEQRRVGRDRDEEEG